MNKIKLVIRFVIRMVFFAVAIMWPAGTWHWWEAWVVVVLWTVYGVAQMLYLLRHDTALLAERMQLLPIHKDQKMWDKIIMLQFFIAGMALYIIPGFDVIRYEWSEPLPLWMKGLAMLIHLPCLLGLAWVMHENTYLSQVVKIDKERGHHVITTGPYAIVRHPMYTIIIVLLFAIPIALGSRFGLIPAGFLTALLLVRTALEDRTLQTELAGYVDYTKQTPYRLIPGIW